MDLMKTRLGDQLHPDVELHLRGLFQHYKLKSGPPFDLAIFLDNVPPPEAYNRVILRSLNRSEELSIKLDFLVELQEKFSQFLSPNSTELFSINANISLLTIKCTDYDSLPTTIADLLLIFNAKGCFPLDYPKLIVTTMKNGKQHAILSD